jgi:hypothetical protein
MDGSTDRRVDLVPRRHTVHVQTTPDEEESLSYDGMALIFHNPGEPAREEWIPHGRHPSVADDEALISALRDALHWSSNAPPSHSDPEPVHGLQ